eukprot:gene33793-56465_t
MKSTIAAGLLLAALACTAATIEGRVVGVADGDTITVLDDNKVQHKIRLAGIDAPEKKQPFGQRSKQSLSDLVFDKAVTVETNKRDKYQREVGKVLVDRTDANLEQAYEREQPAIDRKPTLMRKTKLRLLGLAYGLLWSLYRRGSL